MPKTYNIAVIAGDGIGPEVTREGKKVLQTVAALGGSFAFKFQDLPWGSDYYRRYGCMMPPDGLEILRPSDAILLGAVGSPDVADHITLQGLLLKIRTGFDQYVNLRPIKLLPCVPCPLVNARPEDIDMVVVRENSEGEYANVGGRMFSGTEREMALQTGVFTRHGIKRVMRYAFELAKREGKTLTGISKGNALGYSMVLWDEIFAEMSEEYPTVKTYSLLVDAAAMFFVQNPARFQIVVTGNLFGDILTDLGAAIAGGMGLAAGANLNPERTAPSMFEPIHGSAPDIAGKNIANPLATVWAVSQMLEHLGELKWSRRVLMAVATLLSEGKTLTRDLGGTASTQAVGDEICAILERE